MRFKSAVLTVLIVWGLIFVTALGIAFYQQSLAVKSVVEYTWIISFAFAVIGLLCRSGASKGDTVERTEGVVNSTDHQAAYLEADAEDAARGYAFGTIVMLAASIIFAASLALLHFVFSG